MKIEFFELNQDTWNLFEVLFRPDNGCDGCWCYNHHIAPGSPDVTGEAARSALEELVEKNGGSFVEAYPTPPDESGRIFDFCGHYKIFIDSGFVEKETVKPCYSRLVKEL